MSSHFVAVPWLADWWAGFHCPVLLDSEEEEGFWIMVPKGEKLVGVGEFEAGMVGFEEC